MHLSVSCSYLYSNIINIPSLSIEKIEVKFIFLKAECWCGSQVLRDFLLVFRNNKYKMVHICVLCRFSCSSSCWKKRLWKGLQVSRLEISVIRMHFNMRYKNVFQQKFLYSGLATSCCSPSQPFLIPLQSCAMSAICKIHQANL